MGEFWGWLEGLVEGGTLEGCSLGLSNFRPDDIEAVMKVAKIKPVVNRKSLIQRELGLKANDNRDRIPPIRHDARSAAH